MRRVLVAWIGRTDLKARTESEQIGIGPIAQAVEARSFDEVFLLYDYPDKEVLPYLAWLRERTDTPICPLVEKLSGPTNYSEIHQAAVRAIETAFGKRHKDTALTFHLSPGTPAMGAVWLLLGKTRFPAELIESSKDHGVKTVSVPFDISADFVPELMRGRDEQLREASIERPPEAPEFSRIVHRSRVMERLIGRARKVAQRNVPVLIEGESGTGKELFARAIHRASPRRDGPFITVNCGAIPDGLVDSQLFGHEKGAFTGAAAQHKGHFEAADGGTLFLDEVGELPAQTQVRLLRVLQEGEVLRVGATKPLQVDVRIVAATNRTLTDEIAASRFREDLFYRLAVAVLKLPPLRERTGDLGLLVEHALSLVNQEAASEPGYEGKTLSASAKNLLLSHSWPGNVRELLNTLRRAALWSEGRTITGEDVREALLPSTKPVPQDVLGKPLGGGLNLQELLKMVAQSYLGRAMDEAQGNKTKAAELVGAPSYQTLTNWLKKYEVKS